MSLTIVVPALNEEEAIADTLKQTLAAALEIRRQTSVKEVHVVVVDDGSTDRTASIARGCDGVEVLSFPVNRGYGAAIKAGWEHAPSALLGFMDADGTCDPRFFAPMCRKVLEGGYDLVLGGRMGPRSRMPALRRAGNVFFALLLGHLSQKAVRDTASGMRVVRRSALARLLPLPDGLHFTPAMSAAALMDEDVRVAEIDMPYAERVGRSKLRVVRDGLRFIAAILGAAAYFRVSRLTVPIMVLLAAAAAGIMVHPTAYYIGHGCLEEWMFYRFALAGALGTVLAITLCATIVSEHVVALTFLRYDRYQPRTHGLWRYETLRILVVLGAIGGLVGAALNWPGVAELLATGHVTVHWSRVMVGAFLGVNFALLLATLCTLKIVRALHQRQPFLHPSGGGISSGDGSDSRASGSGG